MIKVVVFDLGKVLLDFDYRIAAGRIAARAQKLPEEVARFLTQSPLLFRYETGLVTNEQFYQEICSATGFGGNFDEFGLCFGDIFTPIEPMLNLQTMLHQRGFPTFIFSNTNPLAVHFIRRTFPFFNHFDGYILSYEHRAMKPDARLYEVVERETGWRGPEILYVDDREENIAAGTARGWQTILQESPDKTMGAVQRLGLLRNGSGPM